MSVITVTDIALLAEHVRVTAGSDSSCTTSIEVEG